MGGVLEAQGKLTEAQAAFEEALAISRRLADIVSVFYDRTWSVVVTGTVVVWDLQTGARLYELTGHQRVVNSVALSGDGRYIVSGSDDRMVAVWDLRDRCTARYPGARWRDRVPDMAFGRAAPWSWETGSETSTVWSIARG